MRVHISLLFILMATFCLGQHSREFSVHFDSKCFLERNSISEKFDVDFPEDAPFAGLTAYILEPDRDVQLWYRTGLEENWTGWKELEENKEGETPGRTAFAPAIIQQNFSQIQFRSNDSLEKEVIFRLYFPAATEKKSPEQSVDMVADSSCSCVQPLICGRSCWCPSGNCPKDPTPDHTLPTHIILHHSAGGNNVTDFAALVAVYWDFHVNTNGWDDIGYNWLIDPNGVIYEGRGDSVAGAHFSCMNSGTTGICLIGNFEIATPSAQAISNLKYLIAWEACDKEISPAASSLHQSSQLVLPHISSHRDGNSSTAPNGCPKGTACPGANFYAMLPNIRLDVSNNPCLGYLHQAKLNPYSEIEIFPNPVQNILEISTIENVRKTELVNMSGQTVKVTYGNEKGIDVKDLPVAMYILKITLDDGIVRKKILIE